MIDWRHIDDLPDALKDGRYVLLWETVVEGRVEVASWESAYAWAKSDEGVWCNIDGSTVHGITHFA